MVGHSNHLFPAFIELLNTHNIRLLVDVRTKPQSRFSPQFNTKHLIANLPPIHYLHVGELGGKNPLPISRQRSALTEILSRATQPEVICFMCSEGDFRDCHRHYTLAPIIMDLGYEVHQINRDGSIEIDAGPTAKTLAKMAAFMPTEL